MIEWKNAELCVQANIDQNNAGAIYSQGLQLIQQQSLPVTVNLAAMSHGSTLALAVLVQWLKQTPQAQGLRFKAVPERMMKIIQACHLEHDLQFIE